MKALPPILTVTDLLLVKDRSTLRRKKSVAVEKCGRKEVLAV